MSYIHCTLDLRALAWVGDLLDDLKLLLYTDADIAGDPDTLRSTSGVFLCVVGPHTRFPLIAISKKQTCTAHSTSEAEIVALELGVRAEGLPACTLWEAITETNHIRLTVVEDNQATIKIVQKLSLIHI